MSVKDKAKARRILAPWRGGRREHPPKWGCDRRATKPGGQRTSELASSGTGIGIQKPITMRTRFHFVLHFVEGSLSPGGTSENSPTIHRWGSFPVSFLS